MQHQLQYERRPRARTRRSDDGLGKAVIGIIARRLPSITMGIVGALMVLVPVASGMAGDGWWPAAVAYGGCLLGLAATGVFER